MPGVNPSPPFPAFTTLLSNLKTFAAILVTDGDSKKPHLDARDAGFLSFKNCLRGDAEMQIKTHQRTSRWMPEPEDVPNMIALVPRW